MKKMVKCERKVKMNNVYIVLHSVVESGAEDVFEVVKVFVDPDKAEEYVDQLNEQIDCEFNEDQCINEEYWMVSKTVE